MSQLSWHQSQCSRQSVLVHALLYACRPTNTLNKSSSGLSKLTRTSSSGCRRDSNDSATSSLSPDASTQRIMGVELTAENHRLAAELKDAVDGHAVLKERVRSLQVNHHVAIWVLL